MLDTTTTTTAEPAPALFLAIPTLSEAINAAHDAAKGAGKTLLTKAREAGDLLLQAKAECAHGEFKAWVGENCTFSYRQAANYMTVAKNAARCTFDPDTSIRAFLDHLTADAPPVEDADATAASHDTEEGDEPLPTTPPKVAKPSTTAKVSELKAEIARLAEAVDRLSGELQAALGREAALGDALATAQAQLAAARDGAPYGLAGGLADGLAGDPPAPALITAEELATLRQDIRDYEEMCDTAQADREALKKEVSDLKRQLHKAVSASPKAALAVRPTNSASGARVDADGYVMQHAGDF